MWNPIPFYDIHWVSQETNQFWTLKGTLDSGFLHWLSSCSQVMPCFVAVITVGMIIIVVICQYKSQDISFRVGRMLISGENETRSIPLLVSDAIFVTYLLYNMEGRSTNVLTAVTCSSQSGLKYCSQKKDTIQNTPVELAQLHKKTKLLIKPVVRRDVPTPPPLLTQSIHNAYIS